MEGAAYPPPAEGYPPQGYPPQGYPQQGYPPQQPYPPQQYPPDYKPPEPAPPYYGQPQAAPAPAPAVQQSSTNVVVVGSQPTARPAVVTVAPTGDYFLTLSIVMTVICALCCSWWALFCTIPAIIVASNARDASTRGDVEGAKRMGYIALGLDIAAIVSYIALWVIIIIISVSVNASASAYYYSSNCYYSYYYYSYYCYK